MLQNRWEDAHRIMDTIGKQEGIYRVRIFNKEGLILFSTDRTEVGRVVDKKAESCYACHAAEKPLERLDLPERARIIRNQKGGRILGMITPIHNEPSCSQAQCHAHEPSKRVLGVLDIGISMDPADANVAAMRRRLLFFAATLVLLISCTMFLLLERSVARPVRDLVRGTERIARGDLDHVIRVRSIDEIGALAKSFNEMTSALHRARSDLSSLVENLEERVEQRTKALREAQAQLFQSEKLASLGKLSASIAHEINNPLSGVLTYAKLAVRRLKNRADGETVASVLQSLLLVERETDRCIAIVRNLLEFARQRPPSFESVDINKAILEAASLLSHRMGMQEITIEKRLTDLPPIWADFGQLRQALVNIMLNACQAMEKGGTLTVTSRFVPEQKLVWVEIVDTGVGISERDLSTIFDPFFTTKEDGTGLGLSVVYGIVERHGGKVDIKSAVGKGTAVIIQLPVTDRTQDTRQ
jgi:two-component system NtrC family sensor kinase